jgi:beta-lactamase regulating signal transducer with metallopeptidase domain
MSSDQIPVSVSRTSATPRATGLGLLYISLTGLWLVTSGLLLLRLLIAYARMRHIRSHAREAPSTLCAACKQLAGDIHVTPPLLLIGALVKSPCLVGFLRPAVLLPESYAAAGTLASREVIVHELAHLARRDCLWNLLGRVAGSILFLQPLVWRLTRRLEDASDDVADDYVVQKGMDRRRYANLLADIAESFQPAPLESLVGVGVFCGSSLERRVERILDTTRSLSVRVGLRTAVAIIALALCATFATGLISAGEGLEAMAEGLFTTAEAYVAEGHDHHRSHRFEQAVESASQAIDILKDLAAQYPAVAAYRHELAAAHRCLGTNLVRVRPVQEALDAYLETAAILETLVAEHPDEQKYRQALAQCYYDFLARWLNDERQDQDAMDATRRALALWDQLVAESPDNPDYQSELADAHCILARTLMHQGFYQEATDALLKSMEILEPLVETYPDKPWYRLTLSRSYEDFVKTLVGKGQFQDAEDTLRLALALGEELVAEPPVYPGYQIEFSNVQITLANDVLLRQGSYEEATDLYLKSIEMLETLVYEQPTTPWYGHALCETYGSFANILAGMGQRQEAEDALRMAVANGEQLVADWPDSAECHVDLAENFALLYDATGDVDLFTKALGHMRMVVELNPGRRAYPPMLVDWSRRLAEMLLAQGRADEAVHVYEQAVATLESVVDQAPECRVELDAILNDLGDLLRNAGRLQEAEHVEARIEIVHREAESLTYREEIVLAKRQ